MDDVTRAVERIESLPEAYVDRNYLQSYDAVLAQLRMRTEGRIDSMSEAEEYIAHIREGLAKVQAWVAPWQLPEDYVFFLEYYGGLMISTESHYFAVQGIGPMVEEWYGFIKGDDSLYVKGDEMPYEGGVLRVGILSLRDERNGCVDFLMDLGGAIRQYGIIGVPSWKVTGTNYLTILRNPRMYPTLWTKLADSFTEWLEQAADTGGTFGYI
jgi:hypothetical protein